MSLTLTTVTHEESRTIPVPDRSTARRLWMDAQRTPGCSYAVVEDAVPWFTTRGFVVTRAEWSRTGGGYDLLGDEPSP